MVIALASNLIGNMNWGACQTCHMSNKCGVNKNKVKYGIAHEEVICKNHIDVFAVIGKINKTAVCASCQIFDNFYKVCGLETMYECNPVEILITSTEVRCLSWIKKGE